MSSTETYFTPLIFEITETSATIIAPTTNSIQNNGGKGNNNQNEFTTSLASNSSVSSTTETFTSKKPQTTTPKFNYPPDAQIVLGISNTVFLSTSIFGLLLLMLLIFWAIIYYRRSVRRRNLIKNLDAMVNNSIGGALNDMK
ncbi:hypothetical protein HDU92_000688, partial [Lobulomyces angularis]